MDKKSSAKGKGRPGRRDILPTGEELRKLLETHKQYEIAKMYGTSASAVSAKARKEGFTSGFSPTSKKWRPWEVKTEHQGERVLTILRSAVKREDKKKLSDLESRNLDEFLGYLDRHKWVVGYDRDAGFFTTTRLKGERYVTTRTLAEARET